MPNIVDTTKVSGELLHQMGLRGEVAMWSFDGFDYWWVEDVLWCARIKRSEPELTKDELKLGRTITYLMLLIFAGEVSCCLTFIFWALGGMR